MKKLLVSTYKKSCPESQVESIISSAVLLKLSVTQLFSSRLHGIKIVMKSQLVLP